MSIAKYMDEAIGNSSWIRKMFEQGAKLRAEFGAENVFDFSLGNPDVEPPVEFKKVLQNLAHDETPGIHGYMPNAGFLDVRQTIAEFIKNEHNVACSAEQIVMTVGAAGALNVVFKTILNKDEEVIVPTPYFVEYNSYVNNHGGKLVTVETNEDFSLNLENIKKALNSKTRAILLNSPNNPTGRIYPQEDLEVLANLLNEYSQKNNQIIYLISDEPYREIVYDNAKVPSILKVYNQSMLITSYSKTLSLPGERIGFIAVNPEALGIEKIMAGLVMANRILGFVNAPALMQRAIVPMVGKTVDLSIYEKRRNMLIKGLKEAGYQFTVPEGAFYLFIKSPLADDLEFVNFLVKYNVLVVPGTGFGKKGYFRLSYCVPEQTIENGIEKMKQALLDLHK